MNKLQVLKYQEKQVRTIEKDGNMWWVLKDVCDVLEISNNRMVSDRIDEDEKDEVSITDAIGRQQDTTVISESGLYNVILLSRKPEAKEFKRWVTHEVLPSIRKHGAYMTPETIEKAILNPDFIINLATQLKTEQEARRLAEAANAQMQERLKIAAPKEKFADKCMTSKDCVLIRDVAKLVSKNGFAIGERKLFKWLREKGVLMNDNTPYQCYIDRGYFEMKQRYIETKEGTLLKKTTLVTPKGQIYIINRLFGKAISEAARA